MKYPIVKYSGGLKPNSWCRWAVNRVKNNNNSCNIRFTGETGSGKTYSAISWAEIMAEMMGRKFTADGIYFSIRDIITEVAEKDPKPGTIFLLDEQQVAGGAKEHNSKKNKAYAIFMSTVRSKRYIFLSTLPFADMADKQVRRLFHVEVETAGLDLKNNTCRCKPRYLEHSRIKDKVYRKRLVINFVDPVTGLRLVKKVNTCDIPKPSEELIRDFEIKKKAFQKKLYDQLSKELADFETAKEERKEGELTPEEKKKKAYRLFSQYQKYIDEAYNVNPKFTQGEVAAYIKTKYGVHGSQAKISVNVPYMINKGWEPPADSNIII